MNIEKCIKETFSVIGKEGSTEDGPGFVQNLWADANSHFVEVALWQRKTKAAILRASGAPCPIFSTASVHGRIISPRGYISPVLNVGMMLNRRRAGRNGSFPDSNTCRWNANQRKADVMACLRMNISCWSASTVKMPPIRKSLCMCVDNGSCLLWQYGIPGVTATEVVKAGILFLFRNYQLQWL